MKTQNIVVWHHFWRVEKAFVRLHVQQRCPVGIFELVVLEVLCLRVTEVGPVLVLHVHDDQVVHCAEYDENNLHHARDTGDLLSRRSWYGLREKRDSRATHTITSSDKPRNKIQLPFKNKKKTEIKRERGRGGEFIHFTNL